ncbi:MAG: hypothetical protein K0B15_02045 [Lentimicrobium sp.]|nr:hypothetical protein [Lentimicrobium sp.]
MPAHKSSGKEKTVKEKTGSPDSELDVLLEQMKLKNEALKKIYAFFEKKKKQGFEPDDNS